VSIVCSATLPAEFFKQLQRSVLESDEGSVVDLKKDTSGMLIIVVVVFLLLLILKGDDDDDVSITTTGTMVVLIVSPCLSLYLLTREYKV
jgi:hypothetical protein